MEAANALPSDTLSELAPTGWDRVREIAWQLPRLAGFRGPDGADGPEDGPPALVIPGFLTSDRGTHLIRHALGRYGWRAHPWQLGTNKGAYAGLIDALEERVDAIGEGKQVLVVGWSLGGLYARELARRCPGKVRAVVTLASPFCGDLKTNNSARWVYEWVAGHDVHEPPFPRFEEKPPVPTIAFWSRKDGVVAPGAACGKGEIHCDRAVEIDTQHMGFAVWRPALSRIARNINRFVAEAEGQSPTMDWRERRRARRHNRKERRAAIRAAS